MLSSRIRSKGSVELILIVSCLLFVSSRFRTGPVMHGLARSVFLKR